MLRAKGWKLTLIADVYPKDAQDIPDDVWMREGCARGWSLLTKDQKIRYREEELSALEPGSALFCLSAGTLQVAQMVDAFEGAKARIHRAVDLGTGGFWHVYTDGNVRKMWP